MAQLLYGSGLRLLECLRLRVKDVDLHYLQITVRDPRGGSGTQDDAAGESGRAAA